MTSFFSCLTASVVLWNRHTGKYALIACALFAFLQHGVSQSKRDARWVMGYYSSLPGNENTDEFGGMYLTFENGVVKIEKFDIFSDTPMATANDENGNLLFYSTGCTIFNRKMQVMDNGNAINPSSYCQKNEDSFTFIRSGGIALPNPANNQLWYNFQYTFKDTTISGWPLIHQLYLTTVDMTGDDSLGSVVRKQDIMIEDTLTGMYSAVRHGNGRDWWVVVPRGTNHSFWRMQITPQGVQPAVLQTLPPPYTPFNHTVIINTEQPPYYYDTIPVSEYNSEANNGQADFSPDGHTYARIIPNYGDVEIYDFNRCTGLLKLRRVFPVPRSPYPTDPEYNLPPACGLSFSPDSRYLYFSNTGGLYQLDLSDNTSDYVLIGTYTGFQTQFFYVTFFQMHLAPDGKIYMGTSYGTKYLHVIDHPNEAGLACGFRERGLELPRWTSWTINYFPNFNLYDDPYGSCDSLGINDPNYTGASLFEEFKVFPNPASAGLIKVYVPPCASARVSVFSIDGKLLYEMKEVTGNVIYGIDCSDWASGVYVVTAYLDGGKPVSKPVFVTH